MIKLLIVSLVSAVLLSGCVANTNKGNVDSNGINVYGADDKLESTIKVDSERFDLPLVRNRADHFFRGYVDKRTGDKRYQMYVIVNTTSAEQFTEGTTAIDGQQTDYQLSHVATHFTGGSLIYHSSVLIISDDLIDYWLAQSKPFVFRLKSSHSNDFEDMTISPVEFKLFIDAMNKY